MKHKWTPTWLLFFFSSVSLPSFVEKRKKYKHETNEGQPIQSLARILFIDFSFIDIRRW